MEEMDTQNNINREVKKRDLWQNMQIAQHSDFNLLNVNDIFSASASGEGIEKTQAFPHVSKTSSMEGKLQIFSAIFRYKSYLQYRIHAISVNSVYS